MTTNGTMNNHAPRLIKRMGLAMVGTIGTYIIVKSILNDHRRKRYEAERKAAREPGHSYQKIAEVEKHSVGAANPSSEESNDPSFGRDRKE
ncbi:uncharacterized protein V1518DRAFT_426701 [Limtongia smithiae]|uniref:uncharacterized protein n=1 Tax=Limtongia smithiae TaxID=1125753 RepID=UPI0034CD0FA8